MKVSVIGLGYIGLPTAAILSSKNISVVGVDINQNTVDIINQGEIHIIEPGLKEVVFSSVKSGHLRATTKLETSDIFMIAVPTPFKKGNKPDLSYIKASVKSISLVLKKGDLIILESTSPVGTTEKIVEWIKGVRPDLSLPKFGEIGVHSCISVAHCPERVLPGRVMQELVENDRVIGGVTKNCAKKAKNLYKIFVKAECIVTDSRTAELSKLVENSFRDVNIAFANELSLICDKLNINTWELINLSNRHPRVNILQPGPGVGGHCIAVDPWFIVNSAPSESKLIRTARLVNDGKPKFVLQKIDQAVEELYKNKSQIKIACLGLSFKADIDDLRESPAMNIAYSVSQMGFKKCYIVEPNIQQLPDEFNSKKDNLVELNTALFDSDIIVLLVDHTSFKAIDSRLLSNKKVIDTKGIFSL